MGVKNLWDLIESCKKLLPLHHLQNKRVCIDLSCWIVQLHNVNKSHCSTKEKVYLRSLFHRLRALLALNCTLIFVTDGSIPAIKLATYRRRLNSGREAIAQDESNSFKGTSLRRNMGSEFSCMIKEAKVLGLALGIPCLDGIEEAEAQCALLNSESLCDGCFTSDSDAFLFGARTVYREICLGEGGHVVCYEMADIERKLGYGRNSLITLALLHGSDYSPGVRGVGLESACEIIKSVGDSNVLQLITSEGVNLVKKTKVSKRQTQTTNSNNGLNLLATQFDVNGNDCNLEKQNQFSQVIDAYLKPKCHTADSDAVYRVLAQHPFQRFKLQQICSQFFQWPPEKTDEYILPKVAERDLRRFANLRLASSKLGVSPPLDQIPVKCPVSKIVKPRKVMGRECFEVLWDKFEGLETSIVPSDLIESACPEKIAEFIERKALEKKQKQHKPRTKKSESTSVVAELDMKLQTLMLDIELGDNAVPSASLSETMVLKDTNNTTATELINQDYRHYKSKDDTNCQTNVGNNVAKDEVIDLLSPSPLPRSYKAPNRQLNDKRIDVINLSDSETELSPGHARKAGNFRLFLASIRDEMS